MKKMRKLNYDIVVGTVFELPSMSWQVAEVAGRYRVDEKTERAGETYYICVNIEKEYAPKVWLSEMCLAFFLGEEVEGIPNYVYIGEQYQPSYDDPYHFALRESGIDEDLPFWYCGHLGENRIIRSGLIIGEWCYFSLPWD
jgi:hypothetical protein